MKMEMKHRYTMLEVALTVGCAGVLAALTVGAAAGMSRTEMNAVCQDHLKKFGAATALYAADSDGFLPFPGLDWYEKKQLGNRLDAWLGGSEPSKNIEMFQCPAGTGVKLWRILPDKKGGWIGLSYGINLAVTGIPGNPYWTAHRLALLEQPAACLLIADASERDIPGEPKRIIERHDGQANLVYADGHVNQIQRNRVPKFNSNRRQSFWVGGSDE